MGGKGYYCDYCKCFMKNDVYVRKLHINGLMHKIAKSNYMAKYRDPDELLREESTKMPCSRFHLKNGCIFGLFCHFSHYTAQQLCDLEVLVKHLNAQKDANDSKNSASKKSAEKIQSMLPWKLSKKTDKQIKHYPISLKPIKFFKVTEKDLQQKWG